VKCFRLWMWNRKIITCVRAVAKRRSAHWNRTSECRQPTSEGLARQQRRLCARNLDLMPAVVHSARQMAQVCQETFYESRWNCSSVLLAPNFMSDLTEGFNRLYVYIPCTACCLKNAQTVDRCSFQKHRQVLLILATQLEAAYTFTHNMHIQLLVY